MDKSIAKRWGGIMRRHHVRIQSYINQYITNEKKDREYACKINMSRTGVYLNVYKAIDGEMKQVSHLSIHDDDDKENAGFAGPVHIKRDVPKRDDVINIMFKKTRIRLKTRRSEDMSFSGLDKTFSDTVSEVVIKSLVYGPKTSAPTAIGGGFALHFVFTIYYKDGSVEEIPFNTPNDTSFRKFYKGTKLSPIDYERMEHTFKKFIDLLIFMIGIYYNLLLFIEELEVEPSEVSITPHISTVPPLVAAYGGYRHKINKYVNKIRTLKFLTNMN